MSCQSGHPVTITVTANIIAIVIATMTAVSFPHQFTRIWIWRLVIQWTTQASILQNLGAQCEGAETQQKIFLPLLSYSILFSVFSTFLLIWNVWVLFYHLEAHFLSNNLHWFKSCAAGFLTFCQVVNYFVPFYLPMIFNKCLQFPSVNISLWVHFSFNSLKNVSRTWRLAIMVGGLSIFTVSL